MVPIYEERFPNLINGTMKKVYNGNMAAVDDAIGALLGALDTHSAVFGGKTVVVFSQDNGGPAKMANNVPLRGAKFGVYEGGVRSNSFVSMRACARACRCVRVCETHAVPTLPTPNHPEANALMIMLCAGRGGVCLWCCRRFGRLVSYQMEQRAGRTTASCTWSIGGPLLQRWLGLQRQMQDHQGSRVPTVSTNGT